MTDKKVYCSKCMHKIDPFQRNGGPWCRVKEEAVVEETFDAPQSTVFTYRLCYLANKNNDCANFSPHIQSDTKKPWWKFWSK